MTAPEARTPAGPANVEEQENRSAAVLHDSEAARIAKLHSTWPALAALAGYELRRLADGRWLASRWAWTRELDEADVEPWLVRIGAMRARSA